MPTATATPGVPAASSVSRLPPLPSVSVATVSLTSVAALPTTPRLPPLSVTAPRAEPEPTSVLPPSRLFNAVAALLRTIPPPAFTVRALNATTPLPESVSPPCETVNVPVSMVFETPVSVVVPVPIFVRFNGMPVTAPSNALSKFVTTPENVVFVPSAPNVSVPAVLAALNVVLLVTVPEPASEPIVNDPPRMSSIAAEPSVTDPPRKPVLPSTSVPALAATEAVAPLTPPRNTTPLPVMVSVPLRTPALIARPIWLGTLANGSTASVRLPPPRSRLPAITGIRPACKGAGTEIGPFTVRTPVLVSTAGGELPVPCESLTNVRPAIEFEKPFRSICAPPRIVIAPVGAIWFDDSQRIVVAVEATSVFPATPPVANRSPGTEKPDVAESSTVA